MKRCPKCNRTYPDDNQKFCTVDGGRLESAESAPAPDLGATVLTDHSGLNAQPPSEPATDLNKTVASVPAQPTTAINKGDTGPTSNRTIAAPFQPAQPMSQPPQQPQPQPPPQTAPPQAYPPPQQQQYQQQPPQPPPQQQPPPQSYQQPPPPAYQQQHAPAQPFQPQPQHAPPAAHMLQAPAPHAPAHTPPGQPSAAPAPRKGSRLPLIIGAVVLLLLIGGGAAYYFLVLNRRESANANGNANVANTNTNANANANVSADANANANTTANANTAPTTFEPPPNATQFINSRANLSGRIAEHFVPFSFYYPNSWELNTSIASEGTYFVRADRKLPPNYVQERFSVEWYESNGTYEADAELFPNLVSATNTNLAKLPGYEKLSEGETKVNSMDAYQIAFKGLSKDPEKGDITYWGRVIFLPPGVEGQKNGLKLTLLTSSLAPELSGIEDVGVKGELPVILDSLRLK